MRPFTVAMLQLVSAGMDMERNAELGECACREAARLGADLALFPEMWSVGYTLPTVGDKTARKEWETLAITRQHPWFRRFQALAAELCIAIGITYLEAWKSAPRNTFTLIDRTGATLLTYAKVHTCDFDTEIALTPGENFPVVNLQTEVSAVQVGAMICYDREFPETARILMLGGAEIILVPNACEMEQNRSSQLRARAYENMVGIALANYAAPQEKGHSQAYDGIAFSSEDGPSRDMCLAEAEPGEQILLAHFDLERLRAYRKAETWGNAYRKPRLYQALVEEKVHEPFIRKDARR